MRNKQSIAILKSAQYFLVSLFFSHSLVFAQDATVKSSSNQFPNCSNTPFDSAPPDNLDYFVLSLYNGLQAEGAIEAPRIKSICKMWEDFDPNALIAGIEAYYGDQGGYLTRKRIYPPDTKPFFVSGPRSTILYSFPQDSTRYYFGKRRGIFECAVEELSVNNSNQHKVLSNVQCIYAKFIRQVFFNTGEEVLNDRVIVSSGVNIPIANYLSTLKTQGIINDFDVDLDAQIVSIRAGSDPREHKLLLTPASINAYRNAQEEVDAAQAYLNTKISDYFLFPSSDFASDPLMFSNAVVKQALQATIGINDVATRRSTFRSELGVSDGQIIRATCPKPDPVTYPVGVSTPKNNAVVDYIGPDIGITRALRDTRGYLETLGYQIYPIDGGSLTAAKLTKDNSILCPLSFAQTVLMDVHGAAITSMVACDSNIKYGTRECCEFLKKFTTGIGIDAAEAMNCNDQDFPPMIDPTKGITAFDAGRLDCELSADSSEIEPNGSCSLGLALPILFSKNPNIPSGLVDRAAFFTTQCEGGNCAASGPMMMKAINDVVVGSSGLNYTSDYACDEGILLPDLRGQGQYCRNPDPNPEERLEPFKGGRCDEANDYIFPWLNPLKTLQGSLSKRGTFSLNVGSRKPCPARSHNYGNDELKQFYITQHRGRLDAETEFYPSVEHVAYSESSDGVFFDTILTSPLKSKIYFLPITPNVPPLRSDKPLFVNEPRATSNELFFKISDNITVAAPNFFTSNSSDQLQNKFGADQSNWKWSMSIRIPQHPDNEAENGIQLIGNVNDTGTHWVFPDRSAGTTPPYLKFNGRYPQGGRAFTADIPLIPRTACCLPNFEKLPDGSLIQNGCTCASNPDLYLDQCGARKCCVGTNCVLNEDDKKSCEAKNGTFTYVPGELHWDAQCCDNSDRTGCQKVKTEKVIENPECPKDDGKIVEKEFAQWKALPTNEHTESQCQPILVRLDCGKSSSSSSSSSSNSGGSSSVSNNGSNSGDSGSNSSQSRGSVTLPR